MVHVYARTAYLNYLVARNKMRELRALFDTARQAVSSGMRECPLPQSFPPFFLGAGFLGGGFFAGGGFFCAGGGGVGGVEEKGA